GRHQNVNELFQASGGDPFIAQTHSMGSAQILYFDGKGVQEPDIRDYESPYSVIGNNCAHFANIAASQDELNFYLS
ncbi:MAG: hypothetical protein OSB63_04925, partial [Planctomycetota bacterium]|nr:hypothetical protein [Planctomycetota bacterium]